MENSEVSGIQKALERLFLSVIFGRERLLNAKQLKAQLYLPPPTNFSTFRTFVKRKKIDL